MDTTPAYQKLVAEFREMSQHAPQGIAAGPINEDNYFEWEAVIEGPKDTPYEGGIFPAVLSFPQNYPDSPPSVKFNCQMFHPNIDQEGTVQIPLLQAGQQETAVGKDAWSSADGVEKVLKEVSYILTHPNLAIAVNKEASNVWQTDRPQFDAVVRSTVRNNLET
ncbi:Ubiquitin-conjugating enzyme E2 G2 [Mortierella sp. GBA35]|nr:Ubiquitin-conjugating enzyme E2 G2 [Mortierella sp. GBA35]KAF9096982.1 Ubiquitin-conjugating enzyme E2 G2 [Mortierella sp. AD031]KAG0209666.1 Ubiquitin-conjugating enzyme E2 G2 [Mortierella sp. NVP41]